jgi:hypothetical protein
MSNFKLSGDFTFNSNDMQSMDKFSFTFTILFETLSKEQHIFIRSKLEDQLGLRAYDIPTAWGDNPIRYGELNFATKEKDFERCKTMVKLLQEGKTELKANGYRYPPDSDHPLFPAINESNDLLTKVGSFSALQNLIDNTLAEAQQNYPPADKTAVKKDKLSEPK